MTERKAQLARQFIEAIPHSRALGMELTEIGDGMAAIRMPYDPHIASGSAIAFRDLQSETREAARRLAATVVEGLRAQAAA